MQVHRHGAASEEPAITPELEDDPKVLVPSFTEEREALNRLLRYSGISRSANLVRFLSFICNKYFDGEADDIRERTVAIEALGRREYGFDSHADPIVRVTARELRKKLSEYYETEGKHDPLHIVLPRGRYIPQFVRPGDQPFEEHAPLQHETAATSTAAPSPVHPPSIFSRIHRPQLYKYAAIAASLLVVFYAGFLLGGHRANRSATPEASSVKWGDPSGATISTAPPGSFPTPPGRPTTSETRTDGAITSLRSTARLAALPPPTAILAIPTPFSTVMAISSCALSEVPAVSGPPPASQRSISRPSSTAGSKPA
jgi:hypothetical protein